MPQRKAWRLRYPDPRPPCFPCLLLQAFANSNNLTADLVRTFRCQDYNPKKKRWSAGMIALFVISGVLGAVLLGVLIYLFVAWRRRRAANLMFISSAGGVSGAAPTNAGHKVVPADALSNDPGYPRKGAVAESVEIPGRRWSATGNRVLPVVG